MCNTAAPLKLYVLVRRDLPMSQQVVQSGHAVAEFLLYGPKTKWNNGIMVILGVSGERQLNTWSHRLTECGVKHTMFYEPDMDGQATALAAVDTGEVFYRLKLL